MIILLCMVPVRVLCQVFGFLVKERHWHIKVSPATSHQDGQRPEAHDEHKKMKRIGFVWSGEVLQGHLIAVFNFLMGTCRHKLLYSRRARDTRHKLPHGKLQLHSMKNICRIKVVKLWNRLPRERLWKLHS